MENKEIAEEMGGRSGMLGVPSSTVYGYTIERQIKMNKIMYRAFQRLDFCMMSFLRFLHETLTRKTSFCTA